MPTEYGASQTAIMRYETYRKAFGVAVAAVAVSALTALLALIISFWAMGKAANKEVVYFATKEDGTILPLVGSDQPYLSDAAVLGFSVTALTESLSLSFVNLEDSIYKSNIYFTKPEGWSAFVTALEESKLTEFIRTNRVVTSVVAKSPRIVGRGTESDGANFWMVQIPVSIDYISSSSTSAEQRVATLKIVQVPTWRSEKAMAIREIRLGR